MKTANHSKSKTLYNFNEIRYGIKDIWTAVCRGGLCILSGFLLLSDAGLFKHCSPCWRSPSQMTVTLLKCYWKMPSHQTASHCCLRSLSSDTSDWTAPLSRLRLSVTQMDSSYYYFKGNFSKERNGIKTDREKMPAASDAMRIVLLFSRLLPAYIYPWRLVWLTLINQQPVSKMKYVKFPLTLLWSRLRREVAGRCSR